MNVTLLQHYGVHRLQRRLHRDVADPEHVLRQEPRHQRVILTPARPPAGSVFVTCDTSQAPEQLRAAGSCRSSRLFASQLTLSPAAVIAKGLAAADAQEQPQDLQAGHHVKVHDHEPGTLVSSNNKLNSSSSSRTQKLSQVVMCCDHHRKEKIFTLLIRNPSSSEVTSHKRL